MKRRSFLAGLAMTPLIAPAAQAAFADDHPLQASWQAWKRLCLSPDGRVVDGFQGGASHSEGQGYGLTLAAQFGDVQAANSIMSWTEANLAVRSDALLAWLWRPDSLPRVADRNNASDGDLFYAWGLVTLARSRNRPELLERARQIAADLLRHCRVANPAGPGWLMLPGAAGFVQGDVVVTNPSYLMPRAMEEVAAATGLSDLAALAADGRRLWATLAANGPVPDWISVSAIGYAPPPAGFSARTGYEAIRIPLFAIWSGDAASPALRAYVGAIGVMGGDAVTVYDPVTKSVVERSAHAGYAAVAALGSCVVSGGAGSRMPVFTADQPYYPATLHLMALVAQAQSFPRCVPI
ncbi:glycosyl hydrolase family 8 [Gemmobacter sp.]|uniref:glycosyl hydrolase family 8 n=1 Tax=Gemmobacter sp. TaxID=1898957 RepID=UPI002AFFB526|nr:glycosyl hydrolase family 8 [Gemmobacter sp.]